MIFVSLAVSTFAQATKFYVALDGDDDDNNGTSISSPWKTLAFAASSPRVKPGDIVYVKAGTSDSDVYSGNVVFTQGGTSNNPIIFEGYTNVPPDNPALDYHLNDPLQARVMPLFDGGNRAAGVAFDIQAPYITIRNFQITKYAVAVQDLSADYHHCILENIIAVTLGKLGPPGGYEYSGKGITLTNSSFNLIKNCVIVNANAEGVSIASNNNTVENTMIYSNEVNESVGADGTDYYIVVSGNNNIIRGCTIERIVPDKVYNDPSYPHNGHGIGFKEAAENNLVEDCVAKNLDGGGFYVRWGNARNNIFRRCHAYGAGVTYQHFTNSDTTGFLCRNGAENNLFESCTAVGCDNAVRFLRGDIEGDDDNSEYAAVNNTFVNGLFIDSKTVIDFNQYEVTRPDDAIVNNSFINCTIYKAKNLIASNRPNQGNRMVNCIVSGVEYLKDPTSNVHLNFSFESNCFYNGFTAPFGDDNISGNPLFVNAAKKNFHLRFGSPCIDTGRISIAEAEHDRNGEQRPVGSAWDMGAYEYKKTSSILFLMLPALQ